MLCFILHQELRMMINNIIITNNMYNFTNNPNNYNNTNNTDNHNNYTNSNNILIVICILFTMFCITKFNCKYYNLQEN